MSRGRVSSPGGPHGHRRRNPSAAEEGGVGAPAREGSTATDLERPVVTTEDGDHERFSHVVVPASAVTEAYISGTPVTALCGKTWVPSRDPKRYPMCPTCKEILDAARAGRDG